MAKVSDGSTQHGARTRDLLLASCQAARRAGVWKTAASIAGWLLERTGGDANAALAVDVPVSDLLLAQARAHLLAVVAEETLLARRGAA